MTRKPRILFVVNVDWFFLSHRLPLALAAKEAGCDVYVAAEETGKGKVIEQNGIRFIPFNTSTDNNVFQDFGLGIRLFRLYRSIQPDLVHHVTIKPVLFGSFAARMAKIPAVVNALSGLGYLYINQSVKVRLARTLSSFVFKFGFHHPNTTLILQNDDDKALVLDYQLIDIQKIHIIRGSGVDINFFSFCLECSKNVRVVLPARMLWDKGVEEFVRAASLLKSKYPDVSFHLVGEPYPGNPNSIPLKWLNDCNKEENLHYEGYQVDMRRVYRESSIICLPSYREGLPKALLEAAAIGRPIVTTDAPGCREIVREGMNGYLVPVKDSIRLAERIEKLILEPGTRRKFGENGRRIVENKFTVERVISETLDIYKMLLGSKWPQINTISKPVA